MSEGGATIPYIGSKISLISKSDIRYEGILYTVDPVDSTVALQNVRAFGTENRRPDNPVPPSSEIYEYIIFRGSDINDIHIASPAPSTPSYMPDPSQQMPMMPPQYYPGYPPYMNYPYGYPGYYPGYPGMSGNPYNVPAPGAAPTEPAARIPDQKSIGGSKAPPAKTPSTPSGKTAEKATQPPAASVKQAPVTEPKSQTPAPTKTNPPQAWGKLAVPSKPSGSESEPSKAAVPASPSPAAAAPASAPVPAPTVPTPASATSTPAPASTQESTRRDGGRGRGRGSGNARGPGRQTNRSQDPQAPREPRERRETREPREPREPREQRPHSEASRGKGRGRRPEDAPMTFTDDFDFAASTALLDKEKLKTEAEAQTPAEEDTSSNFYNPKRSFFDNISTATREKSDGESRKDMSAQRQVDMDTFGLSRPYRRPNNNNNNRNHNGNHRTQNRRPNGPTANEQARRTRNIAQPASH